MFTKEEWVLIRVALLNTASDSRIHGHDKQADEFAQLAVKCLDEETIQN